MKRYIFSLFATLLSVVCLTGCLTHGIDDPDDVYDGADITSLQGVYYRYKNVVDGETVVRQVTLARAASIDSEENTMAIQCQAQARFPAAQ
ncbi:MAG: hypothetical protein K2N66_02460, partial [Paramuribaculum sp.]|nr:hypothetical protein [Paramuribaculum sp.]